ncbi:MAG: hypothetical protein FE78DRAFT_220469 [Acidomyces sp. 'richmondensis']|nr:MAG: hypothetical protein FE78DRAFT_220469 [Acidomyces sp. 'richmondensis']
MGVGNTAGHALGPHCLAGLRRNADSTAPGMLLGTRNGAHRAIRPGLLHAHHGARLTHVRLAGGRRYAGVHHGLSHVLRCRRHAWVAMRWHARVHARLRLIGGHHRGGGSGRTAAVLLGRRRGSGRVAGTRQGERCIRQRLPHPLRTTPELGRPRGITHALSRQEVSYPRRRSLVVECGTAVALSCSSHACAERLGGWAMKCGATRIRAAAGSRE